MTKSVPPERPASSSVFAPPAWPSAMPHAAGRKHALARGGRHDGVADALRRVGAFGKGLHPVRELLHRAVAHAEHLEADGVDQEIGDQEALAAQLACSQVLLGVVADHEHVAAFDACSGKVLRVVVGLGLDGGGVLERGDAREHGRVDTGPAQAPLHGAAREHRHGGKHQRIALGGQRLDGARGGGVRLDVGAQFAELVLVEVADGGEQRVGRDAFGHVDAGQELGPERLGVRVAGAVGGHGGDAALHAGHELIGGDAKARDVPAEGAEVALHEDVDVHGQQRAVKIEEDGAEGSFLHISCLSADCRRWG